MSVATPIPEAAIAAVTIRLMSTIPTATVERDRRAPVDVDAETLPRLVVRFDGLEADTTQEPGYTHHRLDLVVSGYAAGPSETDAAQALYALHASVVTALAGWTPDTAGLGDVSELGAEFALLDADQSEAHAGDFVARFSMLAVSATGTPYL